MERIVSAISTDEWGQLTTEDVDSLKKVLRMYYVADVYERVYWKFLITRVSAVKASLLILFSSLAADAGFKFNLTN